MSPLEILWSSLGKIKINKHASMTIYEEKMLFIDSTDAPESWSKVKEILVSYCVKHTTTTWIYKPRTLPFLTHDVK